MQITGSAISTAIQVNKLWMMDDMFLATLTAS